MKSVITGKRPTLPALMNATVKKTIVRGWALDPLMRCTARENCETPQQTKLQLTRVVHSTKVVEFVSSVRGFEFD
jgi:hypothetical protein